MLLALFAVTACGDDDSSPSSFTPSCDELGALESYRFTLSIMLDSPAFLTEETEPPDAPLNVFAEALTALFSDLELEGAYVAPDRSQATLEFEGEELEWRSIGDRSWIRFGDEWEEEEQSSEDEVLTPEVVCEDIVADLSGSIPGTGGREVTVNGVDAYLYSFDRDDIAEVPELLGRTALTDVPQEIGIRVWLAQDGLWPVKVSLEATDEDQGGQAIELNLEMELSDVNESISIEEPETTADDED